MSLFYSSNFYSFILLFFHCFILSFIYCFIPSLCHYFVRSLISVNFNKRDCVKCVLFLLSVMMDLLPFGTKSLKSTCLLLAMFVHLLINYCHGYILNDKVVNNPIYTSEGRITEIPDQVTEIHDHKRAQFSVNGELRSLAEMLQQPERHREEYSRAKLLKLGKRNWRFPTFKLGTRMLSNVFGMYPFRTDSKITRRRSQQLSVSGPLSALADMFAAEGRRRQLTESKHNKKMLLDLGKRSEDLQYLDDDDATDAGLRFR